MSLLHSLNLRLSCQPCMDQVPQTAVLAQTCKKLLQQIKNKLITVYNRSFDSSQRCWKSDCGTARTAGQPTNLIRCSHDPQTAGQTSTNQGRIKPDSKVRGDQSVQRLSGFRTLTFTSLLQPQLRAIMRKV